MPLDFCITRATVQDARLLEADRKTANLQAILLALGISLDLTEILAELFIDQVATAKAKRLIALTQGNVALESQEGFKLGSGFVFGVVAGIGSWQ